MCGLTHKSREEEQENEGNIEGLYGSFMSKYTSQSHFSFAYQIKAGYKGLVPLSSDELVILMAVVVKKIERSI